MKTTSFFLYLIKTVTLLLLLLGTACQKIDLEPATKNQQPENTIAATPRVSVIMPVVQSDILKFQDNDHLWDYLDFLAEEGNNFVVPSGEEDNDNSYLDNIEATLGFSSLRTLYNTKEELDDNFQENLDIHISDPYYQIVFNEYNELWVGNDIYKYVGNKLLAIIPNNDIATVLDMRINHGVFRNGVTVFDEFEQKEINRADFLPCFFLVEKLDHGVNNGLLYLKIRVIGPDDNEIPFCEGTLTIDWGDGTIDGPTQSLAIAKSHQYNIPNDDCITPTISVSFTPSSCSSCSSIEMYQEISAKVCNGEANQCIEGEKAFLIWEDFMSDSDGEYRARGTVGYNTKRTFWKRPHVWSRLITYKKKNNGQWKRKNLNSMSISLGGTVRSETCTGSELFNGFQRNQSSTNSSVFNRFKYNETNIVARTDEIKYMLTKYKVWAPQQNPSMEPAELSVSDLRIFQ